MCSVVRHARCGTSEMWSTEYSTVQYSTVQYSTVQYSAVQCSGLPIVTVSIPVESSACFFLRCSCLNLACNRQHSTNKKQAITNLHLSCQSEYISPPVVTVMKVLLELAIS